MGGMGSKVAIVANIRDDDPPYPPDPPEDVPALKGWANIGRRFAITGSWPVTFLVTEKKTNTQTTESDRSRLDNQQVPDRCCFAAVSIGSTRARC